MQHQTYTYFNSILRHLTATVLLFILTTGAFGQNPDAKIALNLFDSEKIVFKRPISIYADTLTDSTGKYTLIGFNCIAYDTNLYNKSTVISGKCFCDTFLKDKTPYGRFSHHVMSNYVEWDLGWGGTFELMIIKKNGNSPDTMTIGFKKVPVNGHYGIDIPFSPGKYLLGYIPHSFIINKYYGYDITPKDWNTIKATASPPKNTRTNKHYLPKPTDTIINYRGKKYHFNYSTPNYQSDCKCSMDTIWIYKRKINDKKNKCIHVNGKKKIIAKGKERQTLQGFHRISMEPYGRWCFYDDNGKFMSCRKVYGKHEN